MTSLLTNLRREFMRPSRADLTKPRRKRGITRIRKTEITRVARGIKAAGLPVKGFEVDPATGKFTVLIGNADAAPAANSWDKLLK
jgi:hypothetical protein